MSEEFLVNILFLAALLIGALLGYIVSKLSLEKKLSQSNSDHKACVSELEFINKNLNDYKLELNALRIEKENLSVNLARKEGEGRLLMEKLTEQKNELEKLQDKFTKEFELLANKILEEKSTKFAEQNKESIKTILSPLQEKIQLFEKKVEDTHKESIGFNAALHQQIKGLREVHEQMSKETLNLTKALKGDSKLQGIWGELVLEKVLEKSGLEKDREYFVQKSFDNADGNKVFPDVVINLPDGKKMIVDSKVSMVSYERFINSEDQHLKTEALSQHIQSIKRHVDQLSEKNYQDLYEIESPDFVLMFIPIETAFSVAINADINLYNKAFEKNIVIVTPSTLLATLRTIDTMWTNQRQQDNAIEIARQAGSLYDKFEGFVVDLIQIGKRIDESKKEYGEAMNKLVEGRGNIVHSIEKLKKMGAKAKKSLPENILRRADVTDESIDTETEHDNK